MHIDDRFRLKRHYTWQSTKFHARYYFNRMIIPSTVCHFVWNWYYLVNKLLDDMKKDGRCKASFQGQRFPNASAAFNIPPIRSIVFRIKRNTLCNVTRTSTCYQNDFNVQFVRKIRFTLRTRQIIRDSVRYRKRRQSRWKHRWIKHIFQLAGSFPRNEIQQPRFLDLVRTWDFSLA